MSNKRADKAHAWKRNQRMAITNAEDIQKFSACLRKKTYYSERVAADFVKETLELYNQVIYHYKCPHCKKWHVSHKPRKTY